MSQISFTRRCVPFVVHGFIEETLFNFFFTYLTFKNYPEKVDRWLENLIDRNEIQRTTLNATFDPFAGIPTTKNMASCTSFQWFRILSTMRAQKYKKALEYWYNSFLGRLRVDGRRFFSPKANLEKRFARPEIKTPCTEACHSPFISQVQWPNSVGWNKLYHNLQLNTGTLFKIL